NQTGNQDGHFQLSNGPLQQFLSKNSSTDVTSEKHIFEADGICLLCRKDDFNMTEGFSDGSSRNVEIVIPASSPGFYRNQMLERSTSEKKKISSKKFKIESVKVKKVSDYKKAERKVKQFRCKLLNLGFIERAYNDLKELTKDSRNTYMRCLAAWELALWHANRYTKEDASRALDMLALVKNGEDNPAKMRQRAVLEAECLEALGQVQEARIIIDQALKREIHADLYLASANLETNVQDKMIWINTALKLHGLSSIACNITGDKAPYDCLQAAPGNSNKARLPSILPKVTVMMPAYNAQNTISTALDSVLAQTWTNLEVLVVDDCSEDNTKDVVKSYVQKDGRVRLIRAEVNQGPYVARNLALREATGEFVTVNDADDWSHPEKIEVQVRHLQANPEVIANTSELARIFSKLRFHRRGLGKYIQFNLSSLMFRRQQVIERVGYWDSVRFAADGEFKKRLIRYFGADKVVDLPTSLLSFPKQAHVSLTEHSSFGFQNYFMGARKDYHESFMCYHSASDSLYIDFPIKSRPFPVPEPMWPVREKEKSKPRHFDVVIASDFKLPGGTTSSNVEEIKAQKKFGLRTGLVQMNRYFLNLERTINPKIREQIDGKKVQFLVSGEEIYCDLLIIRHPPVLHDYQAYIPKIKAKNILVIVNQSPFREYKNPESRVYDLQSCCKNLQRYFGHSGVWCPIGPAVRQSLLQEPDIEKMVTLSSTDWNNIINIDQWQSKRRNSKNSKPIIGRHSRDHYVKWPESKDELLAAYPENDQLEIHILGGAETPKNILGSIPKNWSVYPFNSIPPIDFLATIDVCVYFTHSDMVEAFGRTPLEAMAAGKPVILPEKFQSLFKDAAIYATPFQVQSIVMELYQNEEYYQKQSEKGKRFVRDHFGYSQHQHRLALYVSKMRSSS
ncbi:glycosyltransferase, partial [Desulfonatronospira sp.]|uniref:glycosyltransferase n=1 Tax=Desulfonatronospira sp. TaxID=1962951 RepID=UPI0025C328C1